jgi:hypothetical protein
MEMLGDNWAILVCVTLIVVFAITARANKDLRLSLRTKFKKIQVGFHATLTSHKN